MAIKKLIEVALPLDKINEAASYEKMPGIGAHPRGLHLWWARRPFTTARAVIWASLIDDPSSHPEKFPDERSQAKERRRLFDILEKLVDWKNTDNKDVINAAKREIEENYHENFPTLLDPFAGGGAIPLEAKRLGLDVYANDLDPVAVIINKAMIEIPSRFSQFGMVNPKDRNKCGKFNNITGTEAIARDFLYYTNKLQQLVDSKVGYLYPKVINKMLPNNESTIVAWLWTRVVTCPNPACGCELPLVRNFTLAKKKDRIAWVEPIYNDKKVHFQVHNDGLPHILGTVSRKGAICPHCGSPVSFSYIRSEGKKKKIYSRLMAIVSEGKRGKIYQNPTPEQEIAAQINRPGNYPDAEMSYNPRNFNTPIYGMNNFSDLFTNRQLRTLTAFTDCLHFIENEIERDAVNAGFKDDHILLNNGGDGAKAYAEALKVYLVFSIDRLADFSTCVSRWSISNEKAMNCFSKQAIAMTWDYPEVNIFGNAVGSYKQITSYIADCIRTIPNVEGLAVAEQRDARNDCNLRNIMVSTDPPYYDNIDYGDLADFFYIWMRRSLKNIFPNLFSTLTVPKMDELVASPYRHNGDSEEAKKFFENGMLRTCMQISKYTRDDIPVTIYYAYKRNDTSENKGIAVSSGWETMLNAIIQSGFSITGTWPIRTEQAYRSVSMGTNALASSIVLVCRKRPENAPPITRRNLITELRRELRPALKRLQQSNIAPVDLAQAAIGPGMSVFSRYSQVLEADGTPMSVRSAQQIINEEVDMYFNEQVGSMDLESRFCVDLYTQYAYNDIKYGEAEVLANAKGASIPSMASKGILYAKGGIVHLLERQNLPKNVSLSEDNIWLLTQQLTCAMEKGGVDACAQIVVSMFNSNTENAKDLAYRLYTIAEQKKWTNEAYAYNALVVAWPDIQSKAAELKKIEPRQMDLFDLGLVDKK
jgi:putative DNA methylase